jgi:hypothetical protein
MRLKIDTSEVKFRAGGDAKAKKVKGEDARTPDGRPIWSLRLTAYDMGLNSSETIWVEVAGDEPKLTTDDLVQVTGLVYAPWVNRDGKIVRTFRAEQITPLDPSARKAA